MNKLLQKVAKIFLGLSMAAGIGVAIGAGKSGAGQVQALTTSDISSTAATTVEDGAKYVIAASTSGTSFLSTTVSSSWGTAVAIGSAAEFTAEGSGTSNFALKCSAGYLQPKTGSSNSFPSYSSTTKALQLRNTNELFSNANNNYNLRLNTNFRWYGGTSAGAAGSAVHLYKINEAKTPGSLSSTGQTTSFTQGQTFSFGGTLTVTYTDNTTKTVSPASYKFGAQGINPASTGTTITTSTQLTSATHNDQYIYISYTENNTTVWTTGYQISVAAPIDATGITLNTNSISLEQGDSETLTATVAPENASDKTVTWSVSPTGQGVSVSGGVVSVTANATTGNYTVTASANGGTNITATCAVTVRASTKVTDTLNYSFTGISGTGYKDWSGKTGSSGAVYAGQSNAGVSYIQIRATSPSGIVTTTSGGIAKSVKVTWGGTNTNGRTLTIFGKNSAYSEPADLYDGNKKGTSAGTITFTTGDSTASVNLSGNYQYIGILPNGAAYMTTIEITWSSLTKLATPVPTFDNNNKQVTWPAIEHASSYEVKVDNGSYAAATSPYSVSNLTEDVSHTVYVVAKGDNSTYSDSDAGSVEFTPTTPKNIVIVSNTIKENGVAVNATVTKDGCYNDDTFTFTATIVYQSGTGYDEGDGTVTWASSSESVATITSGGIVTPIANGSTTISATPNEGNNAAQKVASFTLVISNIKERVYDYIVDEIVLSDTGISGNSYSDWSGVSKPSGAVYAGTTNENDNGGIGMRASSATGIWVTTSPGVATKVEVTWTTTTSRNVYVFGKDTAYSSAAQYSDMLGEQIGNITYSSTVINLTKEYKFIAMCVTGGAAGFSKIKITWKVPGAEFPLTADPVLSTGSTATAYVGKNLALDVTTTPSNSDEKLIATSSNENYVTVSGSGKSFVIFGVAVGSATVTIEGAKGDYSASVVVTVEEAVKTYEDKIITPAAINITGKSYADNNAAPHDYDGVSFTTHQVQLSSNALSFQQGAGYIQNSEVLYEENSVPAKIKAITLFMHADNEGTATVYEGTSVGPSTPVSASCTTGDIITYTFSSGMTYFKILETGASKVLRIDRFIIELADDTNSVLSEARSATDIIINGLKNTCGAGNSGVVTQSQWNSINSSIAALNLTPDAKLFIKDAARISLENLLQGGVTIENAMAHYDYCVTKFHFTPYEGITHAQASPRVSSLSILNNNTNTVAIIVIISMVSVTAIGGYFFLRRHKENI